MLRTFQESLGPYSYLVPWCPVRCFPSPCSHLADQCCCLLLVSELLHTEKTHVRNLKVMNMMAAPMASDPSLVSLHRLLLPNVDDLIQVHGEYQGFGLLGVTAVCPKTGSQPASQAPPSVGLFGITMVMTTVAFRAGVLQLAKF